MTAPRIIAFAGSTREASLNRKLIRIASGIATEIGADVTLLDLRDYDMPIYNGDLEAREGLPAAALTLKALFAEHQGLLIASPENNACVSALLKNTIDWMSRPIPASQGGPAGPQPFKGKFAALLAASPSFHGGMRGLVALRAMMQTLGVTTLAEQHTVGKAHEAFDADGVFKDAGQLESVAGVVRRLVEVL
ncbi:NAD(P)H-dependent oxidoreductase [Aquincola sp. S2]|uniref:NAD(P)H-dependent oxidoreductase n=1 Tax=Pseudaquabacterium terrae TaxID=2732868 RepID=A0ABX2ESZ4_9BURK|nr:NAD(P)H-dependent oxidoreductase [Aquabacterium terrae]NRF71867.1 NAD(P)H-dependent oxidoreductase [Aquabacterium terrae]